MNFYRTFIAFFIVVLALAVPAFAFQTSGATPISLDGWDPGAAGVQQFTTPCGPVEIELVGINAGSSYGMSTTGSGEELPEALRIGPLSPGDSQAYEMTFNLDFPLVIDMDKLDPEEKITITTGGSVSYTHSSGAVPIEMSSTGAMNQLMLQGNADPSASGGAFPGFGADASVGYITLGASSSLTLRYEALTQYTNGTDTILVGATAQKWAGFSFGKAVPEPNSGGLMAFGLFGMLGLGRKSNRRKVA